MNRKRYKDDQVEKGEVFLPKQGPIRMELGDPKVPYGLWRAIEQMRKEEKARIMVKPAYGFGYEKYELVVEYPPGWESGDKRQQLLRRRAFYDVTLVDWIIKHDI